MNATEKLVQQGRNQREEKPRISLMTTPKAWQARMREKFPPEANPPLAETNSTSVRSV